MTADRRSPTSTSPSASTRCVRRRTRRPDYNVFNLGTRTTTSVDRIATSSPTRWISTPSSSTPAVTAAGPVTCRECASPSRSSRTGLGARTVERRRGATVDPRTARRTRARNRPGTYRSLCSPRRGRWPRRTRVFIGCRGAVCVVLARTGGTDTCARRSGGFGPP